MAKVRIELNSAGIQALLKSEEMAAFCEAEAERMTRATGMEYVPDVHVGKTRVNAAGYDNAKSEEGSYRRRANGKLVYTQRRLRDDQ